MVYFVKTQLVLLTFMTISLLAVLHKTFKEFGEFLFEVFVKGCGTLINCYICVHLMEK